MIIFNRYFLYYCNECKETRGQVKHNETDETGTKEKCFICKNELQVDNCIMSKGALENIKEALRRKYDFKNSNS
jgi:hypothetical protein